MSGLGIMNQKRFRNRVSVLAVLTTLSGLGFAGPVIPKGVEFSISPRGTEFFQERLDYVLKRNQTDLSKMSFSQTGFQLDNPFRIQTIPSQVRKAKESQLDLVTRRLGRYFQTLPLEMLKLDFKLNQMSYQANIKSMGAFLDPQGLKTYGLSQGVVALLRIEAPEVQFQLANLSCVDTQTPQLLGQMNAYDFQAHLVNGAQRPLRIEIPIHIDTDAKGLVVQALGFKTNLNQVALEGDFRSLKLPQLSVKIGGYEYLMDMAELESDVHEMMGPIVEILAGTVKNYFETEGHLLLKESFDELGAAANIRFSTAVPGSTSGKDMIDVNLQPTRAFYHQNHLKLQFKAELKDESLAQGKGWFATVGKATDPVYDLDRAYDVAFALHPGIVNGILQRAFDLKTFAEVDTGTGEIIPLSHAPVIDLNSFGQNANRGKVKIGITYHVNGGIAGFIVPRPLPIEFNANIRFEVSKRNEVDIVLESIDEKSIVVTTKDATLLGLFQNKVKKIALSTFATVNEKLKKQRQVVGSIPTPDDVMRIPIRLIDAKTNNGYIVLYSNFEPSF